MAIGGLDIGSTGCKITVYDNYGEYKYRAYENYEMTKSSKVHEVDAKSIWTAVKKVIYDAGSKFPDMEAIGVTSFGESFVLLDEKDNPLRPIMLYTDKRGVKECNELTKLLGEEKIIHITGLKPHSCYSISKLMWIKKHHPEDLNKTKRILQMADFIVYMLTGNSLIDYSLASRSMAFNIRSMEWSEEILSVAGIDKSLLSNPVRSGTTAGYVRDDVAKELCLNPKTLIVPVAHDQVAAALGAGVFSVGHAVNGSGTVECITPVFDTIPDNESLYKGGYAIVPYVFPGKYVTYAFSFTGGELLRWYIDTFAKEEKRIAKAKGMSVYELLEREIEDKPTGLLVLPHFAGAATPYMDEGSKGVILGLTVNHTISDVYRAMMEGVVYEMRLNMEKLKEAGVSIATLNTSGGGASSSIWTQMKADILNVPITRMETIEAGATGCAMMAGCAAGIFNSIEEAKSLMVKEKDTFMPRKDKHEEYLGYYEKYIKVYEAVRGLV